MVEATSAKAPGVRRQRPQMGEVARLLGWSGGGAPSIRGLERLLTVDDVRTRAKRRTPRMIFDFVDGGADDEISLEANRRAFAESRFAPRVLHDVSRLDTSTTMLGCESSIPLAIGPTGWTRLAHPSGEIGAAWAANEKRIPYTLATLGTSSPAEVQSVTQQTSCWFQLYAQKDAETNERLVSTIEGLGFEVLMVTVDTAVIGMRRKDKRNGLTMPPRVRPRGLLELAAKPRWCIDAVLSPPMRFEALGGSSDKPFTSTLDENFMQGVTVDFLKWLRDRWPRKLVVKGVQSVNDAEEALGIGADGVVLSNHGGRQLDRAPVPLQLLPEVRAAVGADKEILIDSGIRSGVDVAVAVASGANGCLIGRPYLYGLMAGGAEGAARVLQIIDEEFSRTMRLLGARTVAELTPDLLAPKRVAE